MHQKRLDDLDLTTHEQSHKAGRKIKPVREKKKPEDIDDAHSSVSRRINTAGAYIHPLEDKRIASRNAPLEDSRRWDFTPPDAERNDALSPL